MTGWDNASTVKWTVISSISPSRAVEGEQVSGTRMLTLLYVWGGTANNTQDVVSANIGMEGTCSAWVYRGPEVLV